MRIVLISIVLIFAILGGSYFFKQRKATLDKEIVKTLQRQTNTLIGWVQNININESTIIIRRKKLKPFMPKRETIHVGLNTEIFLAEKNIKLLELQQGWPIKIFYKGNAIKKNIYFAEKIEVMVKEQKNPSNNLKGH